MGCSNSNEASRPKGLSKPRFESNNSKGFSDQIVKDEEHLEKPHHERHIVRGHNNHEGGDSTPKKAHYRLTR